MIGPKIQKSFIHEEASSDQKSDKSIEGDSPKSTPYVTKTLRFEKKEVAKARIEKTKLKFNHTAEKPIKKKSVDSFDSVDSAIELKNLTHDF